MAIPESGNVYSYEAYEQLNKHPKHYFDALSSTHRILSFRHPLRPEENHHRTGPEGEAEKRAGL